MMLRNPYLTIETKKIQINSMLETKFLFTQKYDRTNLNKLCFQKYALLKQRLRHNNIAYKRAVFTMWI